MVTFIYPSIYLSVQSTVKDATQLEPKVDREHVSFES